MKSNLYIVESYILRYDQKNERPGLSIIYNVRGQRRRASWCPPPENAMFIVDMLRNEKPVYWSPKKKILTTSRETVGEGER